jgi:hypothetical protein
VWFVHGVLQSCSKVWELAATGGRGNEITFHVVARLQYISNLTGVGASARCSVRDLQDLRQQSLLCCLSTMQSNHKMLLHYYDQPSRALWYAKVCYGFIRLGTFFFFRRYILSLLKDAMVCGGCCLRGLLTVCLCTTLGRSMKVTLQQVRRMSDPIRYVLAELHWRTSGWQTHACFCLLAQSWMSALYTQG